MTSIGDTRRKVSIEKNKLMVATNDEGQVCDVG